MLRKITLFSLIVLLLMAASCKKKDPVSSDSAEGTSESVVSGNLEMGYALRVNTGLYTLEGDTGTDADKTKWIASLNLGDSIMLGETRKATFTGDNRVYDFVAVRDTNGREGYAFALQIAAGGRLAVVTDDKANLYKNPNPVDVTGSTLSRKTVVVYYPETRTDGFVEIRAYDSGSTPPGYRHGNYVRFTTLSEKKSDIQSSILLQTALPLNENDKNQKARKEALLESALLDYPDSVFHSEIYQIVNPDQNFDNYDEDEDEPLF